MTYPPKGYLKELEPNDKPTPQVTSSPQEDEDPEEGGVQE